MLPLCHYCSKLLGLNPNGIIWVSGSPPQYWDGSYIVRCSKLKSAVHGLCTPSWRPLLRVPAIMVILTVVFSPFYGGQGEGHLSFRRKLDKVALWFNSSRGAAVSSRGCFAYHGLFRAPFACGRVGLEPAG